jgi:regulatory protein YycI of two-component signal transduction system YycFG
MYTFIIFALFLLINCLLVAYFLPKSLNSNPLELVEEENSRNEDVTQ